ncbi:hypothetical protein OBBRIDRAFT_788301 [Obba rivulosa]|uniref:Uncharacterized protein n=1 Tax=Obba rivulosa TaxID=1052685 RepID=A0A8E2DTB0_9APHY|nr:hypothetical protein OBBRIDRAFT_788301 [Obba rivulosa]
MSSRARLMRLAATLHCASGSRINADSRQAARTVDSWFVFQSDARGIYQEGRGGCAEEGKVLQRFGRAKRR